MLGRCSGARYGCQLILASLLAVAMIIILRAARVSNPLISSCSSALVDAVNSSHCSGLPIPALSRHDGIGKICVLAEGGGNLAEH